MRYNSTLFIAESNINIKDMMAGRFERSPQFRSPFQSQNIESKGEI